MIVAAGNISSSPTLVTSKSFCSSCEHTNKGLDYDIGKGDVAWGGTCTVRMYSRGVGTRDSSSGKRREYLSRTNLCIVTMNEDNITFNHVVQ